ncbi:hypothetical protein [Kitasatospora sp. NPDC094015]|uniref:hypothetical protein n=1 Tax=Kitasatospora sp. NPDC094015 TaxID=3155205 RepID=UPI00332915DB
MTDQENTPPAVWDPTARGGAGGWVRRKAEAAPDAPGAAGAVPGFPGAPAGPAGPAGARGFDDNQPTTVLPPVPGGPGPSPFPPAAPPGFPPGAPQPFPGRPPAAQPFPAQPFPPQPFPPQSFPPQPTGFPGAGHEQSPVPGFDRPPHPPYGATGDYPEPEEAAPRRGRTPLMIAVGAVLLLVVGVGVTWAVRNSGTGSAAGATPAAGQQPPPAAGATPAPGGSAPAAASPSGSPEAGSAGPNAAAQAKALDALLAQAETARAGIGSSVAKVRSCPAKADIDSAVAVFDSGAQQRDQLIAALAKLELGDLPGGADLAKTLSTAWQQSGDIDRAYAAWGRTVSSQGCVNGSAPGTADYKRADDLNPQATRSKNDFAGKWKPIADAYGLTPRTADRI